MLFDLGLDFINLCERLVCMIIADTIGFIACGWSGQLTLTVIDVDNRVAVLQAFRNTTDEPLGALRRSVDSNQTEWTLGSRHDDDVKCVGKTKKKGAAIDHGDIVGGFISQGRLRRHSSPHSATSTFVGCKSLPLFGFPNCPPN